MADDSQKPNPNPPIKNEVSIPTVIKATKVRGRPFVKGQCANPAGRPKGSLSMTTLLKEAITKIAKDKDGKEFKNGDTYAHLLVKKVLQKALQGDGKSIELLWAYIDGKPSQAIQIEGQIDTRVQVLSDDQLKKIAKGGKE